MITDQKTQNKLHAETGTELFSIRQRKEAVTRMLDILKETPEYLQVMNHIPAYAMDDDTSEWWNSEESKNFMNSLLEVMESYTPDGYFQTVHLIQFLFNAGKSLYHSSYQSFEYLIIYI